MMFASGITFSVDSDGIANLGLSLPGYITGDFVFGGGITFEGDLITLSETLSILVVRLLQEMWLEQ